MEDKNATMVKLIRSTAHETLQASDNSHRQTRGKFQCVAHTQSVFVFAEALTCHVCSIFEMPVENASTLRSHKCRPFLYPPTGSRRRLEVGIRWSSVGPPQEISCYSLHAAILIRFGAKGSHSCGLPCVVALSKHFESNLPNL